MDPIGGLPNDPKSDLTIQALDQGCLQELFSRCTTTDLPLLAQTCKTFRELLTESELVWAERLRADYGMHLQLHSSSLPGSLFPLANHIYTAPRDDTIRFQGTLVSGSVDDMNMWYWVDNLFKKDRSYFCSDASTNVDCLGLLLDGDVERDKKYTVANHYMRRRCRYAAALFEHIHHPEVANPEETLMNMIEEWSDQHLENFFLSLADNLQNDVNNPVGRLLFYDVPEKRIPAEEQRIRAIVAYLKDRLKALKKDLVILPPRGAGGCGGRSSGNIVTTNNNISENTDGQQKETLFDSSVLPKLQPDYPERVSSIIYELHLSRAGSLTCPVSTGVIFVGIIDRSQLKGLDAKTIAERLQSATRDPICTAFNNIDSTDALLQGIEEGKLPEIAFSRFDEAAGFSHEFEHSGEEEEEEMRKLSASVGGSQVKVKVPLISWKPLLWFKFNNAEELDGRDSDEEEEVDEEEEEEEEEDMEEEEEEQPPSSLNVAATVSHGAHSGAAADQQHDPWGNADLDDMSQGQPLIYPPAGDPVGGEPVAAGGVGGGGGNAQQQQQEAEGLEEPNEAVEVDEALGVPPFMQFDHTIGRNELHIPLKTPVIANVIMVKLINQENLMDELMDGHAYPNIDMTYVHVIGKRIIMSEGIDLKAAK
jgi:hypothetical protein